MSINSLRALWSSFIPGSRLVDGGDCLNLANQLTTATGANPITALAGGGQVGATPLTNFINEVGVVATDNDSVMLPPALPGTVVVVNVTGAHAPKVYGQTLDPNTGAGATIAPHDSSVQTASATGNAQAAASVGIYFCFANGKWKQTLLT